MNTKIIAEIGCNHKGDMSIAKKMIEEAKKCGVWAVKFQKRNNKELLTSEEYNAPHPNPWNSYGETYGKHREALEFTLEQHRELKKHCEKVGVVYMSSVWDCTSTVEIASLNPSAIKIPSAMNLFYPIYQEIIENYPCGNIHISLGMTTNQEIHELVRFLRENNLRDRCVLYVCTSSYPVENKDVCLLDLNKIKELGFFMGFSGHHRGIQLDVAAVTLGAEFIERHFTLDRTWKGTDHAASLEPAGLAKLVRDIEAVEEALHYKNIFSDDEKIQRKKLKKFGAII